MENNIVKISIIHKGIYRFNAIPIKIPMIFFAGIEKPTIKSMWNLKGPQIGKAILNKNNKTGDIILPYLKTSYKATVIKLVWS